MPKDLLQMMKYAKKIQVFAKMDRHNDKRIII